MKQKQTIEPCKKISNAVAVPHNPDLEAAVLGALLLEPQYVPDVRSILTPSAFYDDTNATIYAAVCRLDDQGTTPDITTVANAVRLQGIMPAQVAKITQFVGSGVAVTSHAMQLAALEMRRELMLFGAELEAKARTESEDVAEWAAGRLDEILGTAHTLDSVQSCGEVIEESLRNLERRQQAAQRGECVGITTGISHLDRVSGGWRGGQLVIIAGRPAMGKTAVSITFTRAAAEAGVPVCYFSLEMPASQLVDRMLVGSSAVDAAAYRSGTVNTQGWVRLEAGAEMLRGLPVYLFDKSSTTMPAIRAQCRAMQRKGRCSMVVIDYLQLLDTPDKGRGGNREREVAEISRGAKLLAKEMNVPVIMLAQLSRKVDERVDKTPLLSDLRESGAIEQDADIVVFIDRPAVYGAATFDAERYGIINSTGAGRLTIAKNREGATGFIPFRHNESLTSITDYDACGFMAADKEGASY